MGFAKLSKTQVLLLLRHIRTTDPHLYDYIRTIRKMKKILPVICGNGDVQAIHTTQVSGSATVGDVASADLGGCGCPGFCC
jgi:exonuclease I